VGAEERSVEGFTRRLCGSVLRSLEILRAVAQLGFHSLILLLALAEGEARSKTVEILGRVYRIESQMRPYGVRIYPVDN
jgi:hypothetical protein